MTKRRTISLMIFGILAVSILIHATQLGTQHAETEYKLIDSATPAQLDPDQVNWTQNNFPNGGFEQWDDFNDLDEVYTYATYEKYGWYASSPWPVNEGSKSVGLQIRSNYPDETSEYRFNQQSQSSWDNPTNTTVRFDFYIDETPVDPTDWSFYLEIRLGWKYIYYYLASDLTRTNSSSYAYYPIEGVLDTWN
ncbi:hypothetical protein EU538_11955, partial [Candidatus Thorarchaeota archaeon]